MNNKQYYTWEEIGEHDDETSMWIVADNKVYDVTTFWKRHPGGSYLIKSKATTDVTRHKKMHTTRALAMWEKYHIGYLTVTKQGCC